MVEYSLRYSRVSVRDLFTTVDNEQTRKVNGFRGRSSERINKSAAAPDSHKDMAGTFKITIPDDAKMPHPTNKMYEGLALRAWIDYRDGMEPHVGHEMPDWDELPPHLRAVWERVAHGMVGIMAIYAGGKVTAIDAN